MAFRYFYTKKENFWRVEVETVDSDGRGEIKRMNIWREHPGKAPEQVARLHPEKGFAIIKPELVDEIWPPLCAGKKDYRCMVCPHGFKREG